MKTQARFLVIVQFVLFALLAGAYFVLPPGQVVWARVLGALLTLAGLIVVALALLTYMQVNRNFVNVSPEPNDRHELVQVGIYGLIRHPIYTGVILTAFGTALVHGHIAGLVIAALICAFFTYKSSFEER
jgi:protein-S-isoprenylcysteine O-methyltransferase Ste14